jgi:heme-degrading monooxygenase HmoA
VIAATPPPPYWAVIFTNLRTPDDDAGYAQTADQMEALASAQPGYLGIESVRDAQGFGITVSYWSSLEAIAAWRAQADQVEAERGPLSPGPA